MDDIFSYDDDNGSKNTMKKVGIFGGIVAGVVAVASLISILIFTGLAEERKQCEDAAKQAGVSVNRCDNKFKQVFFVVGDTANTPVPSIAGNDESIIKSLYDGGKNSMSVISVSKPNSVPELINVHKAGKVKEEISAMTAEKDGADYLEAIRKAASYAKDRENTLIYVIGSGLSDRGLLNFAGDNLLINYGKDEIVNAVSSKLSDEDNLRGITIYWDGLGVTSEPQEELPVTLAKKEEKIYSEIFEKLGATFKKSTNIREYKKNDNVKTNVKTTSIKGEGVTFVANSDSSELAFIPGNADFRNKNAALNTVRKIVSENRNASFIIEPFVSRGVCDKDADKDLLKKRADATRQLFIDAGVSDYDIEILEGGLGDPSMPSKECPKGSGNYGVVEKEATKNRKVEITVVRK